MILFFLGFKLCICNNSLWYLRKTFLGVSGKGSILQMDIWSCCCHRTDLCCKCACPTPLSRRGWEDKSLEEGHLENCLYLGIVSAVCMLHVRVLLLLLCSSKTLSGWGVLTFSRYGTLEGSQGFEVCGSVTAEESMQLCKFSSVCLYKMYFKIYIIYIDKLFFLSTSIT